MGQFGVDVIRSAVISSQTNPTQTYSKIIMGCGRR